MNQEQEKEVTAIFQASSKNLSEGVRKASIYNFKTIELIKCIMNADHDRKYALELCGKYTMIRSNKESRRMFENKEWTLRRAFRHAKIECPWYPPTRSREDKIKQAHRQSSAFVRSCKELELTYEESILIHQSQWQSCMPLEFIK